MTNKCVPRIPLRSGSQAIVVFKGLHVLHRRFAFAIVRYILSLKFTIISKSLQQGAFNFDGY